MTSTPSLAPESAAPAGPWWRSATNPPCVDWCHRHHDPDEFAQGGAMLCAETIADNHMFQVDVQSMASVDDDATEGVVVFDPPAVWVDIKVHGDQTPAKARELGVALIASLSEAALIAEMTVRA